MCPQSLHSHSRALLKSWARWRGLVWEETEGKEGTNKTRNIRKEGPRRGLPYHRPLFPAIAGKPVELIFHVVCTLKPACPRTTAVSSGL